MLLAVCFLGIYCDVSYRQESANSTAIMAHYLHRYRHTYYPSHLSVHH